MNKYNGELMTAKDIALETWRLISRYYDNGVEVEKKPEDGSPVTLADKIANKFILEKLDGLFPDDGVISEEEETKIRGKRRWYIDPIDGTKGFIKRNGHFAIHIGFCEDEKPTLGVVYAPSTGEIYYGVVGQGAWRENARGKIALKVRDLMRKKKVAVVNGDDPPEELIPVYRELGVTEFHNSGGEGLRLMKLAENIVDIRINENPNGLSTWDLCAPHAIFEAAGGFVRYLDGEIINYIGQRRMGRRYVATNSEGLMRKVVSLKLG